MTGRGSSIPARLYLILVLLLGGFGLAWLVWQWRWGEVGAWQLALFIGLAGVLDLMVVPVAGGGGAAASFGVYFAGLLVLGAGPTACVAAIAGLWSEGLVRRTPLLRTGFNAAHSVLSLLAAGQVYRLLGGRLGQVELPGGLPAMLGAMLALWLLETGWASLAVGLERGGRVWRRLRGSLGPMLALDGALAAVGLLLALLYQHGWHLLGAGEGPQQPGLQGALLLGAVTLIPPGLLYYAYRLQGHLSQVYAQSLRTLGALMEAKVEGSQPGHGEQVAALAAAMAQALELPVGQVEQIRYAGYLHDIGKVGAPAELEGGGGARATAAVASGDRGADSGAGGVPAAGGADSASPPRAVGWAGISRRAAGGADSGGGAAAEPGRRLPEPGHHPAGARPHRPGPPPGSLAPGGRLPLRS